MNKKTSIKVLKITSIVLAVEAVVVLILLLWLLLGDGFGGENVDNSADSVTIESSFIEEWNSEVDSSNFEELSDGQENSAAEQFVGAESSAVANEQGEANDASNQQGLGTSSGGNGSDSQANNVNGGEESEETLTAPEPEESLLQSNWGEIDWN